MLDYAAILGVDLGSLGEERLDPIRRAVSGGAKERFLILID
jgi:hypothetical protein